MGLGARQSGGLPVGEAGISWGRRGITVPRKVYGPARPYWLPSFWAEGGRSRTSLPSFLLGRDREPQGSRESC